MRERRSKYKACKTIEKDSLATKIKSAAIVLVFTLMLCACSSGEVENKTFSQALSAEMTADTLTESEKNDGLTDISTDETTTNGTNESTDNVSDTITEPTEDTTGTEDITTELSAGTSDNSTTREEETTTKKEAATEKQTTTQKQTTTEKQTTTQKQTMTEKQTTTQKQTTAQEQTTTASSEVTLTDTQRAEKILAQMTLEEKVGQMFIARCPSSDAKELAKEYQLGGYILFARDFADKTKAEVISNISGYQSVSSIPMLIGVDEEGGTVNRVSKYTEFRSEAFKSPQELFSLGGYDLVRSDAIEKSVLLKSLGINVNFAPVADVSTDASNFIYKRTFGQDATATAQYVRTVVSAMNSEGMGSVLKHFPGYGSNEDTHTGIVYDTRDYNTFVTSDFLPFKAGIDEGAGIVMVAHNVVYCMDCEKPASLSAKVHKILREELSFEGVIITDELSMDGVTEYADDDAIAVMAVQAGNDLLCCTNFEEQIKAVIAAVKAGTISEERINESVMRILKLKMSLGILI